jgi:hypothetical protein
MRCGRTGSHCFLISIHWHRLRLRLRLRPGRTGSHCFLISQHRKRQRRPALMTALFGRSSQHRKRQRLRRQRLRRQRLRRQWLRRPHQRLTLQRQRQRQRQRRRWWRQRRQRHRLGWRRRLRWRSPRRPPLQCAHVTHVAPPSRGPRPSPTQPPPSHPRCPQRFLLAPRRPPRRPCHLCLLPLPRLLPLTRAPRCQGRRLGLLWKQRLQWGRWGGMQYCQGRRSLPLLRSMLVPSWSVSRPWKLKRRLSSNSHTMG